MFHSKRTKALSVFQQQGLGMVLVVVGTMIERRGHPPLTSHNGHSALAKKDGIGGKAD